MIALSWSRLQDLRCPYLFKAKHIDKTYVEPETREMRIGSAVHLALAEYRKMLLAEGAISNVGWLSSYEPVMPADCSDDEITEVKKILSSIDNSPMAVIPVNDINDAMVERKLCFDKDFNVLDDDAWYGDGPDADKVAFRMIADFCYIICDTLYVIDDKTGWGEPDPKQLKIYAALLHHSIYQNANEIVCLFYDHRRNRIIDAGRYEGESEINSMRDVIMSWLRDEISFVNSLGTDEFVANVGTWCVSCKLESCPHKSVVVAGAEHALATGDTSKLPIVVETEEQAQSAMKFLIMINDVERKIKNALESYVAEHGPVALGDKQAVLDSRETWKCTNLASLIGVACNTFGASSNLLLEHMKITKTDLLKFCKKANLSEEQTKMLLAYGKSTKSKLSLKFKKVKQELW